MGSPPDSTEAVKVPPSRSARADRAGPGAAHQPVRGTACWPSPSAGLRMLGGRGHCSRRSRPCNSLPNFDEKAGANSYLFTIASYKGCLTPQPPAAAGPDRGGGGGCLSGRGGGLLVPEGVQPGTRGATQRWELESAAIARGPKHHRPVAGTRGASSASRRLELLSSVKGWANKDVAKLLKRSAEKQVANYRFVAVKKLGPSMSGSLPGKASQWRKPAQLDRDRDPPRTPLASTSRRRVLWTPPRPAL